MVTHIAIEAHTKLQCCKHQEQLGHTVVKLYEEEVTVGRDSGEASFISPVAKLRKVRVCYNFFLRSMSLIWPMIPV